MTQRSPSVDELIHYGVKGMKWGVRRNRTEATTLTKEQLKEAKEKVNKLKDRVFDEKFLAPDAISETQYNKLSTKAVTIKKGQTVGRVTQRKDEQLRDKTYVYYKPGDADVYKSVMTLPMIGGGGRKTYKNSYEHTFKSLETLRSPSEKERVDAFIDLFDKPSITTKSDKKVTGREYMKNVYPREVKTLTSQQLGLHAYKAFAESQYMDTPLSSAYFKSLSDKGYNAVVDDNDRGHLAEAPLIVLNPNGTLKRMKVKQLSADDINNAQRRLKVE